MLVHLNQGETYTALAGGFGVGTATVFRDVREGVDVLAAMAPTMQEALDVARWKAFVILDGTLLPIDRVGMVSGHDRTFYSGKYKRHGLNVQVLADPTGRLMWASPALPGARHDMGAAREHGLLDGLNSGGVRAVADTAYQGGGPAIRGSAAPAPPRTRHQPLPAAAVPSPEGGQRRARPPARPGRASGCSAQVLDGLPTKPQLSPLGTAPGQGRDGADPGRLRSSWKSSLNGVAVSRRSTLSSPVDSLPRYHPVEVAVSLLVLPHEPIGHTEPEGGPTLWSDARTRDARPLAGTPWADRPRARRRATPSRPPAGRPGGSP